MSTCLASPGPLTTHPSIERLICFFIPEYLFSIFFTVSITSNCCLAQEGQDIIVNPDFLIPKAFKISIPTFTSFTGLSDKETLIVSPIPSLRRLPIPIDDFTVPVIRLPASVIPKCKG